MRLFRWWFNGKTVERIDPPSEPKPEIAVGSLWVFRGEKKDPFPRKSYPPVRVLAVKDGWVRYDMPPIFRDSRLEIDSFIHCYEPMEAE